MAYGTVKVNFITFDIGAGDQTIPVVDIATALSSGISVTGTISGQRILGSSGEFTNISGLDGEFTNISGINLSYISGEIVNASGTNLSYSSGHLTNLSGNLVTYTSGNIETITGTQLNYTSGLFSTISGTTLLGTLSGNAATATELSSSRNFTLTGDISGSVSTTLISGFSINASLVSGTIVDADINASAAIAGTKIDANFGTQVITTTGSIVAGTTNLYTLESTQRKIQSHSNVGSEGFTAVNWGAGSSGAGITLAKSQAGTIGNAGLLGGAVDLGRIDFYASDGISGWMRGASIVTEAASAHSSTSAQTDIFLMTTPSGAVTPTERMRISSNGNIGIGTVNPSTLFHVEGITTIKSDSSSALTFTNSTENYGFIGNSSGNLVINGGGTSDTLVFQTNAIERGRIESSGRLLLGTTTGIFASAGANPFLQVAGAGVNTSRASFSIFSNDGSPSALHLTKSRGTSVGVHTVLSVGDNIGFLTFDGSDGSNYQRSALVAGIVDDTPSSGSVPGRLSFSTTPSGTTLPIERLRIRSDGNLAISNVNVSTFNGASNVTVYNSGNINGSVTGTGYANYSLMTVQNTVTSRAYGYRTVITTAAASFTCTGISHYEAGQLAFGAGSSVVNQYGFIAASTITGAANNYSFYGSLASASGRWNYYADGTAPNYFAGDVRTNRVFVKNTTPVNSNVSSTATAISLIQGLRNGTPTSNITLQLPTGTNMEAQFQDLNDGDSFEWSLINGATSTWTITVTINSGHSVFGNMVVDPDTSGRFLTRRTSAGGFVTYRIS